MKTLKQKDADTLSEVAKTVESDSALGREEIANRIGFLLQYHTEEQDELMNGVDGVTEKTKETLRHALDQRKLEYKFQRAGHLIGHPEEITQENAWETQGFINDLIRKVGDYGKSLDRKAQSELHVRTAGIALALRDSMAVAERDTENEDSGEPWRSLARLRLYVDDLTDDARVNVHSRSTFETVRSRVIKELGELSDDSEDARPAFTEILNTLDDAIAKIDEKNAR